MTSGEPENHALFDKPALALYDFVKHLQSAECRWLVSIKVEDLRLTKASRQSLSLLKGTASGETSLAFKMDILDLSLQIQAVVCDLKERHGVDVSCLWITWRTQKRLESLLAFLENLRGDNAKEDIERRAVEEPNSTQTVLSLHGDTTSRAGSTASTLHKLQKMIYEAGTWAGTNHTESSMAQHSGTGTSGLKSWSVESWLPACFGR